MYLLMIGIVSLLGQLFLTRAFTHTNAVVVQVVSYMGLMLNVLFGFLFWNEVPDIITIVGGVMIVAGCIALSRSSHHEALNVRKTDDLASTIRRK
ncbi:EamA-like transporter family protein [compost metagenome]